MDSSPQFKRILIVEDDESHAELIRRGFSEASDHYRLTVATSMQEALARVQSNNFDIVLTDYLLPDGKGVDLVLKSGQTTPVVIMTSHGNEQLAVDAMKAGALDYVVKMPEVFEAMPRIIERALREWDLMLEHKHAVDALLLQTRQLEHEVAERQIAQEALQAQAVLLQNEIAERRQAQETQRLSEEKFSKAFDNAPMIMTITMRENGTLLDVNNRFLEVSGWCREDVIGKTTREVGWINNDDRAILFETLNREGHVSGLALSLHPRGGRTIKAELYIETITVDGSERLLGIAIDVTERHKLEEQLRHSQKLEAVGLLAGGVAHDFNNILTVIGGYCEMLKLDLAPGHPLRDKVLQISAASERASNLTRSLLAFSRKGEVKAVPTDLNLLLRGVEKFLQRIIGEDITLSTKVPERAIWAVVDSGQIDQVLMNLAANARDAMPKGGSLFVELERQEIDAGFVQAHGFGTPGSYALLTVSDTGQGMDEETRNRIFDPFFTTKVSGKGTGLGLAIVYGIVIQHKGFVNVYSEPGVGSTFRIYLPVVEPQQLAGTEAVTVEAEVRGCETILVAEDDLYVLDLVTNVLVQYGYSIIHAANGEEAVQKFQENDQIALVLMDIIMPVMNGKEAAEKIRRLRPEARILFTSGYTAEIIKSRCELEESAELIMKPVKPALLLKKVREMLDRPPRISGRGGKA
ncbi:response receiver histidine kinase response regulator [Citrifermentans bemidjiense Bem]|uniref:histidine kinase n=1 Tax=Citrifermentans bemidjiense (strain ATCC BAA-1014 / DSM 16622 / JCM 12645 / Bem) TaxID=404380 RepID=B5EBU2_CITBB|nr:response regulator [Citrifermentans bemidjiense]ACH38966.1 response receiver histidine kinase response regulator [Citrifermentans bemidjiense Bem]